MLHPVSINDAFKLLKVNKHRLSLEFVNIESVNGDISLTELFFINSVISNVKPQNILELGTFKGRTTINMALNSKGSQIHTVDLPFDQDSGKTKLPLSTEEGLDDRNFTGVEHKIFEDFPEENKRIKQYWYDTADLTPEIFGGIKFDFIFIDASHAYEYVKHDSNFAFKVLSENGFILWHDYGGCGWPGVIQALNELSQTDLPKDLYPVGNTSFVVYGI